MQIEIKTEDLIEELEKRIEGWCYCRFDGHKKDLKPIKDLLEKRWEEPLDTGCIE